MDNVWSIMDLLFAGAGLYAIYAYYLLKTKGEITTSILMSKDVDIRKCKDIEGYKRFVAPKILIFGIAALLYGILVKRIYNEKNQMGRHGNRIGDALCDRGFQCFPGKYSGSGSS